MKKYEIRSNAMSSKVGEYILGFEHTGSHACYMIYGILKPGEKGRVIKPGKGHEELVLALDADIEVTGSVTGTLEEGCAFHIAEDNECFLQNTGRTDATYIVSGGHSEKGHH